MSSDHTWIRNSELAALRNSQTRAYQAEQAAKEIQARTAQREREIRSQYESSVTSLTSQINTISRQYDSDLRRVSDDFRSRIAKQAVEFKEQFDRQRAENQRDINALEKRVYKDLGRIETDVRDMDNRFTKNIEDFTSRFNELANKESNKQKRAEVLLNQLDDMLATVGTLKPEKFNAGGLFGQMKEQLARGKESFRQGDYEAAIAVANVNLTNVAALQQRLAYENSQFNALLSVVREATNTLRSNIDMLTDGKPVHNFEFNGETITRPYDINHWTNGRFNDFCNDVNGIERRLEIAENDASMGLEQLDAIREQLNSWTKGDGYLHLLDEEGKQKQISSIAVDEMTSRVYEILDEKGWHFVDSGRPDEDDRNPNTITYEDNVGNQVVLIVSASDDPTVTPIDYEVYANGEDNRDSEYTRSIKKGIKKAIDSLQGGNIERGETERRNDCHTIKTPQAFIEKYATTVNKEQVKTRS